MPQPLVSDALWDRVAPLLPRSGRADRHVQHAGRKPSDPRKVLNGIVFVLTTGVPWRALPATSDFPSGHTCRRQLLRWHRAGVWQALQRQLLAELRRKGRLHLSRAVVDSVSQRAPAGGRKTGKNPVERAKAGVKHHLLTDARGTPLAVILTGANRHDVTQLMPLLEKVPEFGGRPGSPRRRPRSLYGDRGYDSNRHRRRLKKNADPSVHCQEGHLAR
jgi:transposase